MSRKELYKQLADINSKLANIGADKEFFKTCSTNGLPKNFMDRCDFETRAATLEEYALKYKVAEEESQKTLDSINAEMLKECDDAKMHSLIEKKKVAQRILSEANRASFMQKMALHNHHANITPINAIEFRRSCSYLIDQKLAVYKHLETAI
jgi:hypothetical protein